MAEIIKAWRKEVHFFEADKQAINELRDRVLASDLNGPERLRQMHKLVVETPVEKRAEYGMIFLSIWHEMATRDERAQFISEIVSNPSDPTELKIAETYLKTDLVDKDKALRADESGESDKSFAESFFDASHYTSNRINFSSRLTALLFSVGPGATLRDVAAAASDGETRELLERAQTIRAEMERSRNSDSWEELQTTLAQLSRNGDLAVQAYLARVIAWGRELFPQLNFKSEISEKISANRSSLILYLLSSNQPENLLEIPGDDESPLDKVENRLGSSHNDPRQEGSMTPGHADRSEGIEKSRERAAAGSEEASDGEDRMWLWVVTGIAVLGVTVILVRAFMRGRAS